LRVIVIARTHLAKNKQENQEQNSTVKIVLHLLVGKKKVNDDTRMEVLNRRCRVHMYLSVLTRDEINKVLEKHVPDLRSIQVLRSGTKVAKGPEWWDLVDEYNRSEDAIVESVSEELKTKFLKKIPKGVDQHAVSLFLQNCRVRCGSKS